jgi:hypothetical protein
MTVAQTRISSFPHMRPAIACAPIFVVIAILPL